MKTTIIGTLIALIISIGTTHAETRIWTDKKGNSIEAEFVTIIGGKVILKKANGKQIKVPQVGLCDADQKYLENAVPPKIDIDVNVNKKRKKLQEFDGYVNYSERVTGKVTLLKKNKNPSNKPFVAHLYIFSKDHREDEIQIIEKTSHKFSFEHQKKIEFSGKQTKFNYSKWLYGSLDHGEQYEGYLVIITDNNNKIIGTKGSRSILETKASQIMKAKTGSILDL